MTINKVTSVNPTPGSPVKDVDIQAHINEQNADGWTLIAVMDFVGWYRFFWSKSVE